MQRGRATPGENYFFELKAWWILKTSIHYFNRYKSLWTIDFALLCMKLFPPRMRHERIPTASSILLRVLPFLGGVARKFWPKDAKRSFQVPKPSRRFFDSMTNIDKPFNNRSATLRPDETWWDWMSKHFQALARSFSSMMSPARVAWHGLAWLGRAYHAHGPVSFWVIPCLGLTI